MLVTTATQHKPLVFKSLRSLFTHETPTIDNPIAVQGGELFTSPFNAPLLIEMEEIYWIFFL